MKKLLYLGLLIIVSGSCRDPETEFIPNVPIPTAKFDLNVVLCDPPVDPSCVDAGGLTSKNVFVYKNELDLELGEHVAVKATNSQGKVSFDLEHNSYLFHCVHDGQKLTESANSDPNTSVVFLDLIFIK